MPAVVLMLGVFTVSAALADDIAESGIDDGGPRTVGAALQGAQHAVAAARRAGNLWLRTPIRLREARAAAAAGESARAIALADQVAHDARLALNQARLERARYVLNTNETLAPDVRTAVRELLLIYDGAAALRVLEQAGITR